jgi:hypothetical protein
MTSDDPIVMWRSSDPVDEAAGGHGNACGWVEISSAVAPPYSRDNNAEAVSGIVVWRVHEARPPIDERVIETRAGRIAGEQAVVTTLGSEKAGFDLHSAAGLSPPSDNASSRIIPACRRTLIPRLLAVRAAARVAKGFALSRFEGNRIG